MALFSIKLGRPTADIKSMEKHASNVLFGVARGLTQLAKEGQAAAVGAIEGKFTNRKKWFTQNSPIGIRVKPATKGDPVAEIRTAARFMPLQDTGGIKLPYRNHIAIPAKDGPLGGKRTIPPAMRPKALMDSGRGFILQGKGDLKLMCIRGLRKRGRYAGVTVVYLLVKQAKIKRADVFDVPIEKVIKRRGPQIIDASLRDALKGKTTS